MVQSYFSQLNSVELPLWQVLVLGGAVLLTGSYISSSGKQKALPATTINQLEPEPEQTTTHNTEEILEVPRQHIKLAQREGTKMVLVVRTDLKMAGGKVASQCAHATLECYRKAAKYAPEILKFWEYMGQAKITVKCRSQSEMEELNTNARELGLVTHLFKDDHGVQSALTVLGVGPGPISVVDKVTGHLKLY